MASAIAIAITHDTALSASNSRARARDAVVEASAETNATTSMRVRFYESCAPRALGEWIDERTCVVTRSTNELERIRSNGRDVVRYLRENLGVTIDVDRERGTARIRHRAGAVVVEAARILNLSLERGRGDGALGFWGEENVGTPTPHGEKSPSVAQEQEAIRAVTREFSPEALEAIRARLESKRVTRRTLLAHLGEPTGSNQSQSIALTNTLVRIRLPRKRSFSEERQYGVGVAMRVTASCSTRDNKPTWVFVCDMGGSKFHHTDVMYISNEEISIAEVCRMMANRRGIENTPRDVFRDFFDEPA